MMAERAPEGVKKIIPFAPTNREPRDDSDPMDRSGHAIVSLLQQAADTANRDCERAMDMAHKMSTQLRTAEEKIKELEADIRHYHERAQRREKWLARIDQDVEEKFFEHKPPNGRSEQR